jgi:thiol-disulfide isomerase/thioredoxin
MIGLGAAGLAYVLIAAAQPKDKPWEQASRPLLTGTVEDFEPTVLPRPVPDALLSTPDGPGPLLSQLVGGGQVTVVNLWATWCAPCIEEMPQLAALDEAEGVRVVPVAMQRLDEGVIRALTEAGFEGEALADPDLSLMKVYGRSLSLPLTVIYDARGQEAGQIMGAADWTAPEARRLVEAIRDGEARF